MRRLHRLGAETIELHIAMLNDRRRTSRFLEMIKVIVEPGDVVVDIGTGTGVLAIGAAQAGASRVYAIEAGRIAFWAQQLFEANGVADRITIVPRWSGSVRLPEQADVLVSEVIGDEPLAEGVIEITRDAWRRFARPDAKLVPSAVRLLALPVSIPLESLGQLVFTEDAVTRWSGWYGISFAPLVDVRPPAFSAHFVNPFRAREWTPVTRPIELARVDLREGPKPAKRLRRRFVAERSAPVHGVVVYFELEAEGERFFSTEPAGAGEENHWLSPLQVLDEPYVAIAGEDLELAYSYHPRSGVSRCRLGPIGPRRLASIVRPTVE